jgi:CubicO group peptidase (beta-lactamase class C family)
LAATPPFADVDAVLRDALGVRFSGAVVRIAAGGRVRFERAYGATTAAADAPPVYVDTRFDLASITKVFVATFALAEVAAGRLDLDTPLVRLVPEWRATAHASIALRDVLAHAGGFRSGADYRMLLDRNVEAFALAEPLVAAPRERVVYSDIGFIALGTVLTRATATPLATLAATHLRRLGVPRTQYRPHADARCAIAATERDAWRGLVHGSVHDEKAALMGGVAGHAGLFGDAAAVGALGEWYLAALHDRPTPLDRGLARLAVQEAAPDPVLRRGLGWALKTSADNSCGARMAPATFGHTGFTGTSIWVDPERDLTIVLLTNAVHFGRNDIRTLRAAVCDAAVAEIDR